MRFLDIEFEDNNLAKRFAGSVTRYLRRLDPSGKYIDLSELETNQFLHLKKDELKKLKNIGEKTLSNALEGMARHGIRLNSDRCASKGIVLDVNDMASAKALNAIFKGEVGEKYRFEINVSKYCADSEFNPVWRPEWSETTVTTKEGLCERFETLAKSYGSRKAAEQTEDRKLDPVRQILRKVRKKVAKGKDILGQDCFLHNYNRAHIEFLSLGTVTLDHEPEFALKRLYRAAAHIVKTIEQLEQDDE